MTAGNKAGMARVALATALLIAAGTSHSWAAANTKGEGKCQSTMTKTIGKHALSVSKAMDKCMKDYLVGGDPCPNVAVTEAIAKSAAKVSKSVDKKCQSACSATLVPCIGSPFCPPNGILTENCTDQGKNFFEATNMGFPGSLCEGVIDKDMVDPEDFGLCAGGIGDIIADSLFTNIYGDLNGTPALSDDATSCLNTIAKQVPKTVFKMGLTVGKCRNTQLTKDPSTVLPDDCPTADPKTSEKLVKFRDKVLQKIADSCTDAAVAELSLCGAGTGGLTTVAEATDCFGELLDEASFSTEDSDTRNYAGISIINGAYPDSAPARCGDNVINQAPNQFLPNGEECDGTDLGDCAACLPPGDVFECTCAETRRTRTFADGFTADLDNGWSGSSHNASVTDRAGFVAEVSNCDCDAFTGATCTGTTGDNVCDVFAELKPRCSHRIGDGTSCDEVGNEDTSNNDQDCQTCDAFAGNAGDYCTGSARVCLGGTCSGGPKNGSSCAVSRDCGLCAGGINVNKACLLDGDCPGSTCSPGTCVSGANNGDRCNVTSDDCAGSGTCDGAGVCLDGPFAGNGCTGPQHCGVCLGGDNAGQACSVPANCPGSTCEGHSCVSNFCLGGASDGEACTTNGDCPTGRCAATSDCESQCYDENDVPQGPCWRQEDCGPGERCRGICDTSNTCVILRNGAPLPLSAEGTSVCIDSKFFTNMTGTRDIVTGAHEVNYDLRSVTILDNEINSSPCPVCGGWCAEVGSQLDRFRCSGNCTGPELECRYGPNIGMACLDNTDCADQLCAPVACRFDDDCPNGTCDGSASPDCQGNPCRLDLACSYGPNEDKPCRLEAYTAFGTTSADCPADPATNVSGVGLAISWTPLTSGVITAENPAPCDASGYQNYDCNCVTGGGGTRTQPNRCLPACNAGAEFGNQCNAFTQCVGGLEAGAACDEDSDCTGGTCSANPRVCGVGNEGVCSVNSCSGGSNDGNPCASTAQCPGGTCPATTPCTVGDAPCTYGQCVPDVCTTNADCEIAVTCDNACPSGRCTPLCVTSGLCSGGPKDGLRCALDVDCLGGTCIPDDPEEGACAKGAFNHCDGPGWEFVSCAPLQVGTQEGCEFGTDSIGGNANDNIGAGYCVADVTNCFINDGAAEGGTTLNGKGDPTNTYSVAAYCVPASTNSAVNATAGLPGPGRIRQAAVTVPNFTSLP